MGWSLESAAAMAAEVPPLSTYLTRKHAVNYITLSIIGVGDTRKSQSHPFYVTLDGVNAGCELRRHCFSNEAASVIQNTRTRVVQNRGRSMGIHLGRTSAWTLFSVLSISIHLTYRFIGPIHWRFRLTATTSYIYFLCAISIPRCVSRGH